MSISSPSVAETFFTLYTGTSNARSSDLRIQQPANGTDATFRGVSWRGEPFEAPPYYGIKFGGYSKTQPNWGVELDFIHYKVFAETDRNVPISGTWNGVPVSGSPVMSDRVQSFSISHGVNTLALNVLYRLRGKPTPSFPHGRIQPYVGAGPAYYILHPENVVNNESNNQSYEFSTVGWQALGGVRYGLSSRTSLFAEAKYSSGTVSVGTADSGWARTKLRATHAVAGVQYGF